MDMVIDRFMKATGARGQIVVLGAGSDTTYLRMKQAGRNPKMFVEIDLPGVVSKKLRVIRSNNEILNLLGVTKEDVDVALESDGRALVAKDYALARVDLRNVDMLETVLLHLESFDFSNPTLFVSECVLCYVDPKDSKVLLEWIINKFEQAVFTAYEQILPNDAFGRTMIGHFKAKGCPLLAINTYPDLHAQRKRFQEIGWSRCQVLDMNDIYYKCIDKETLKRAEKLEIFDEFEEWHMMQGHYCVALAVYGNDKEKLDNLEPIYLLQDS